MAKIILEREKCIGCGSCAALCPKFFEIADDGKTKLLGSKTDPKSGNEILEIEKIECLQEAADACPLEIIHIIKK